MSSKYRKPDQIIQPCWFGSPVKKSTCLWLKGLPILQPTNIVTPGGNKVFSSGKIMSQWYYDTACLPHAKRALVRSKTFQGIAEAMAKQWGPLI